jgi:hypothetical protein
MRRKEAKSGPKTHLQALLQQAGVEFPLSDHFYQQIVLSMNGAKGMSGEFLVHAAVLDMLRVDPIFKFSVMPKTQHVLETPDGARRIDLNFAETRFSVEIKSGYVRAKRDFRKQVGKDVWLLQNRPDLVSEVMWVFLRGATSPARRYLDEKHIAWIDFDLENRRPPIISGEPAINRNPSNC